MKLLQYICFTLFCSLYIIIFLAVGYLANFPPVVLQVFLVALCSLFVFAYFWGGQTVLAIVRAQKLSPEFFRHKVDNISCLLRLPRVRIYEAKGLPPSVYVLKGAGDSSHILFGGDVFDRLSPKELDALLCFSILKVKKFNLRFIQGCNFFFFVVSLPVLLTRRVAALRCFCLAMEFFLLPLKRFKDFVFRDDKQYFKNGIEKLQMDGAGDILETILFKLKNFPLDYSWDAHRILLAGLSAVEEDL